MSDEQQDTVHDPIDDQANLDGSQAARDIQPDAVYYHPTDYAPVLRRFGVFLIDLVVCIALLYGSIFVFAFVTVPPELKSMTHRTEQTQKLMDQHMARCAPRAITAWFALCVAYSILLRKTRIGTLGYLIMRVKLVDKTGHRPSWGRLCKRFLWGMPLSLFFGLTYLATRNTERRQAVHDQMCGTWVVKARALPAGLARTAYQTKLFGTYMITYDDVEPVETEAAGSENDIPIARAVEPVSPSNLREECS